MNTLFLLFYEFFKAGLFAVGGGLATIPFLTDISNKRGWFTLTELADMIAVGESTPGPIGVNCATYVGFKTAGIPGALTATLALILPSYIIICIIFGFLQKYKESKLVNDTFAGLRPAVTGLIAAAGWSVLQMAVIAPVQAAAAFSPALLKPAVLLLVLLGLSYWLKYKKKDLHPLAYIGLAAVAGIVFAM
ncbi:MAG: chromate transporter [Clostridia bacterium]|nr:chromate transporter [Clostridia bacterium]